MISLVGMHPFVKKKAEELLVNANNRLKHHKMILTQAHRTNKQQDEIYAQGRTRPGDIVTNAKGGQSTHNYGLAIDFALLTPDGKKAVWDTYSDFDKDGKPDWSEVVEEAKKLGFTWGGDWKSFVDKPHLEMTAGLTIKDLQAGIIPDFSSLVDLTVDKIPLKSKNTYRLAKFVDTVDKNVVKKYRDEGYLIIEVPK